MQIISQSSYLFINIWLVNTRLPRWYSGKESACQFRRVKRCRFEPWVRKILWRRKWLPTLVLSPGKFHGQRSLAGYSPWGRKSQTRLSTHTPTKYYLWVCQKLGEWERISNVKVSVLWERESVKMLKSISHVGLYVTPWIAAHQASLFIEFSRQEQWSG